MYQNVRLEAKCICYLFAFLSYQDWCIKFSQLISSRNGILSKFIFHVKNYRIIHWLIIYLWGCLSILLINNELSTYLSSCQVVIASLVLILSHALKQHSLKKMTEVLKLHWVSIAIKRNWNKAWKVVFLGEKRHSRAFKVHTYHLYIHYNITYTQFCIIHH